MKRRAIKVYSTSTATTKPKTNNCLSTNWQEKREFDRDYRDLCARDSYRRAN